MPLDVRPLSLLQRVEDTMQVLSQWRTEMNGLEEGSLTQINRITVQDENITEQWWPALGQLET